MPVFVAVYFDPEGEQRVRELWQVGYDEGFDPTMQALGIRPHLTLGGWDSMDIPTATASLRQLAEEHRQFSLTFDAVGSFAIGAPAIVLIPHVSEPLSALHAGLHEHLSGSQAGAWPHYAPGHWAPHCTVALNIPEDRFGDAFATIRRQLTTFTVTVEQITLADAYPLDTKALFTLTPRE